jgi:hypothetical protein
MIPSKLRKDLFFMHFEGRQFPCLPWLLINELFNTVVNSICFLVQSFFVLSHLADETACPIVKVPYPG